MANLYIIEGAAYNGDGTTSAEAVGSTVTITIASPGVVTWTGHSFVANDVVYLTTTGALPTGLTAATKYYVRNPAANTFELSATSGGASINTSGTQSGVHTGRGVGAWNHIDIFAGTAVGIGSAIAAGDVVYMRSKTGNGANANIAYSPGAAKNYGSSAGTAANPVTWILDNGVTWPGVNGTFTITGTTSAHTHTHIDYNDYYSLTDYALIFENTAANITFSQIAAKNGNTFGLKFNLPNCTNAGNWNISFTGGVHTNLSVYVNQLATGWAPVVCSSLHTVFINPKIEVAVSPAALVGTFSFSTSAGRIDVFGGQIVGTAINAGNLCIVTPNNFSTYASVFNSVGLQVPKIAPTSSREPSANCTNSFAGLDGGVAGAVAMEWGYADSRNLTNNYPTLNATLADSGNSPTSWRVYPKATTKQNPFEMPISELYTATAAAKTVTLHFLATTSWSGSVTPNTHTVWMTVTYIDSTTSLPVTQTTKAVVGGSLTGSGLTWTPSNSWGAVSLSAYKLELTTGTSIKQNTTVMVTFMGEVLSANANDILIFCPSIQLS